MSEVIVLTGAYGVGKSEFASQLALTKAPCVLADFDVINPYFRPREQTTWFESKGVKIIEIGARIGGYRPRMYNYSYGLDLIEQEVKLAIAEQPSLDGEFSTFCAVYELFPEHEGKFHSVAGDINISSLTYYRETAKSGQLVGPAKNGYKASAIIIVTLLFPLIISLIWEGCISTDFAKFF